MSSFPNCDSEGRIFFQ